jgi:hypothetical protein
MHEPLAMIDHWFAPGPGGAGMIVTMPAALHTI